jgi:hypothetical protein
MVRGRSQHVVIREQVVVETEDGAVQRRCVRSDEDFWRVEERLEVLPSQSTPLREGLADAFFNSPDPDGLRVGIAEQ